MGGEWSKKEKRGVNNMRIRVLGTIKQQGQLHGFVIISNKPITGMQSIVDGKNVYRVDLRQAQIISGKQPFENVACEKGKWSGTECSINRMPEQDIQGNYVKGERDVYVLSRLEQEGRTKGYSLLTLAGQTQNVDKQSLIKGMHGRSLVNAKIVRVKGGLDYYIAGVRGEIPTKELKKEEKDIKPIAQAKTEAVGKKKEEDGGKDMKIARMKKLVPLLREAAFEYYQNSNEIMSNYEYDKLYDELEQLEQETGVVLAGSVTQQVGYVVQSKLPKVKHLSKMMSLDKTKDRDIIGETLCRQVGFLSWKLDGITLVVTYKNGELVSAVTRGDGTIGEDVTNNYKVFSNVPRKIAYKGDLVVRGEGVISYRTFARINGKIKSETDKYKNPRNLAAGSIRQLETQKTAERDVEFVVFTVVEGYEEKENYTDKLEMVRELGFSVVEYEKVTEVSVEDAIARFEEKVASNPYPTDGLVLSIDNIEYGEKLGCTSKFPKNAKAFKWADDVAETELIEIHWSPSRTGAINPVAVFKPVDIEGTTVQRASVHNVSIVEELKLGIGDTITIFKANMIIPQVGENLTKSGKIEIPSNCPVCGGATTIKQEKTAKVLMCTNEQCIAKHLGNLVHFVGRDAMNIDGLSESTLEKLVAEGIITDYKDIYHIRKHQATIENMEGFGKRSYEKLAKAIESSRKVEMPKFLYSLGVEQLGRTASRLVCQEIGEDLETILGVSKERLLKIEGIGEKTANEIVVYFTKNQERVRGLAEEMSFVAPVKVEAKSGLAGKVFVITGSLNQYGNRKELQAEIEAAGGKVSGSVSSKTTYLVNNDTTSSSSKNKKAQELGVKIISEEYVMGLLKGDEI